MISIIGLQYIELFSVRGGGGWGASILKGSCLEMAAQGPGPESIMDLGSEGLGF